MDQLASLLPIAHGLPVMPGSEGRGRASAATINRGTVRLTS
jgi:hypothetical protein